MTHHAPSRHSPASSATDAAEATGATLAARAGHMALRIAEIAARQCALSEFADELASYLRGEMGANAVALYRCRHGERRQKDSTTLQPVGVACDAARTGNAEAAARRLMMSGYRALSTRSLLIRPAEALAGQSPTARLTFAAPLGTPDPWAVVVVVWADVPANAASELRSLCEALRPTLALATRSMSKRDTTTNSASVSSPKRTVFAVTSEAIVTLDDEYTIREVNPAFTTILGWSEHDAVGRRCSEIVRCRDDRRMLLCGTPRCPLTEAFSAISAPPVRELSWETQVGKLSEVSASFTVQRTEHAAEAVIVARDMTLVNAANRMRANFISMVSHELRTPLNSINGFLEIVLESPVGPLNERQREFLNYARISTQQLATLVEDILFISKADSGQFTLRLARTRMTKAIEAAVQAVQSAAEKAQVQVITQIPQKLPILRADELRIQQVLTNLLGNAIKFSPSESEVRLSVSVSDTALQFAVADSGKGIAPEDHARIFERFYQSDSNVRNRAGGYGLGLSIAKLIVEQHHGRIWVVSEPGEGATFYFTLPLDGS